MTEPGAVRRTEASASSTASTPAGHTALGAQISLVDLLDRLLGTGVVLAGDVVITLAGVDLVHVRLNALITTVRADMKPAGWDPREGHD